MLERETEERETMEFEKRKEATLAFMNSPEPDKSPKGTVDTPILPLLKTLNSHPSYFTTSSCSGRISILSQPTAAAAAAAAATTTKKKAKGGTWLYITHDPTDPESVLNLLFPTNPTQPPLIHLSDLVFRFEPLIIAVECKDVSSAQFLVSLAISSGFRESGITSVNKRVILAIRCSIRLEVPLGDNERLMVSPEYIRYLVGIANEKMEANRRRTDSFLNALISHGFTGIEVSESVNGPSVNAKGDINGGSKHIEIQNSECHLNSYSKGNKGDAKSVGIDADAQFGSLGVPGTTLSIIPMVIVGEPVEKLLLWGHSACPLGNPNHKRILIFGGFGGMGRHARRNDSILLDPLDGKLEAISVQGTPSPRLGHTSSVIGDFMFVIGGRADPMNILNEVWVLNTVKNEWNLLEFTGSVFPPRHRHAAAVVGSKIYVFGGILNDVISSSLCVLDINNLQWTEICIQGKWPCPRHSHSLVAFGSRLFMFGGYDGEKALGDLYSFDVQTCLWKKEKMAGRTPYARFSHSMFVYKNYLGIVGGCPVRQHYQELSLLDLHSHLWKHVMLNSVGKDLFVRCTASVVGDDLVMIGGGAACYAFGTKFSEPMKINLLPVTPLDDHFVPAESGEKHVVYQDEGVVVERKNGDFQFSQNKTEQISNNGPLDPEVEESCKYVGRQMVDSHWVLQLERQYAKLGKDILKIFGWLDVARKVYPQEDGIHICFPVTEEFCAVYCNKQHHSVNEFKRMDGLQPWKSSEREGFLLNDISCSKALNVLIACGATKLLDEVVKVKKFPNSPLKIMTEAVASLVKHRNLPAQLLEQLPTRWERLGDINVIPVTSFRDPIWDSIGEELWPTVAKSLGTRRLARQGRVASTGTRDSNLEILVGDNGWVDHRENGILYSFDATKCMFSWGNYSEKLRMACLDCRDQVVVDLFAGIGYFVLPFLVRANAKLVYACEWNPHAIDALQRNLHANSVADRCVILEGDNRITAPKGVADRVCLGLLPTSEGSWATAVKALRSEGGILHVHGNVRDSEVDSWTGHVSKSIHEIAVSEGYCWEIAIEHLERVKWYAPHIRHIVADLGCKQVQR
ncbi:tRNA wybutosine-synthesizing protein 2/3/4 [Cornus florida]|uniref:tRNA wybutosine-synthesizing protein 2/3/4 n=1 Tax=Cornus florida TaxID=4283 RepID=UPI0028975A27|nr:tRNA wybutosine-synthesizing protein 2/3/4 [Cornus florida]